MVFELKHFWKFRERLALEWRRERCDDSPAVWRNVTQAIGTNQVLDVHELSKNAPDFYEFHWTYANAPIGPPGEKTNEDDFIKILAMPGVFRQNGTSNYLAFCRRINLGDSKRNLNGTATLTKHRCKHYAKTRH